MDKESLKAKVRKSLISAFRLILLTLAASTLVFGVVSCDMLEGLPFFGKKKKKYTPSIRKTAKKKRPEKKEKKAEEKEAEEPVYVYTPADKTDPFVPFLKEFAKPEKAEKKAKPTVPLTPLQKVDTTDFTLVAVVWGESGKKAMVEDPAGKGYIIERGTLIGTSRGRVKKILDDKVVVEEERLDPLGNTILTPVELRLPKTPLEIQESAGLRGHELLSGEDEGALTPPGAREAEALGGGEETPEGELPSPEEELPQPPASQP